MLRPCLSIAGVSLGVLLLAGACKSPNLGSEDDGLSLPDRTDPPPATDAPVEPYVEPTDSSVPDTAVADAADAAPPPLRVFLSSSTTTANFSGIANADTFCMNLATAAKLGGTWTAWLSNENGPHAINRVTSAGPWHLVSGEMVSASKVALASGTLSHAIDHDEKGALVAAAGVWTGTGPDGMYLSNDCNKWSNGGNEGRVGLSSATNGTWTSQGTNGCGQLRRVYCFQLTR